MLTTTGYNFEGYIIKEYLGVVSTSVVLGTGFLSSTSVALADIGGFRSSSYENKLNQGRITAINELKKQARELGGSGIIGIDIDYTTFASDVLGIVASGTAVRLDYEEKLVDSIPICSYNEKLSFNISNIYFKQSFLNESIFISLQMKNYFDDSKITALIVDIEFEDIFHEKQEVKDLVFVVDRMEKNGFYSTKFTKVSLKEMRKDLLQKSYVVVKKVIYNNSNKVENIAVDDVKSNTDISVDMLKSIRKVHGQDVVVDAETFTGYWQCYCGATNSNNNDNCYRCKREKPILSGEVSAEEFLYILFGMNTAQEIYEYLIKLNLPEFKGVFKDMEEVVRKEKLYGNMKDEALKVAESVFS